MQVTQPVFKALMLIVITLTSCKNKDTAILKSRNFENGKWLLVVENKAEETLFVIDNKNVLNSNPYGIILEPSAYCGGTTCDGFIALYKDGELVASREFLNKSDLIENKNIRQAYKKATSNCIEPGDKNKFRQQWDSLEMIKNTYPTHPPIQPGDKDIICFYKY